MPQYIRPTTDVVRADDLDDLDHAAIGPSSTNPPFWRTMPRPSREFPALSSGATAATLIDETVPDTADYFESNSRPLGDVVAVETGNPGVTPGHDRNHLIRVRLSKDSSGGQTLACFVELRQGYASEQGRAPGATGTPGTLISRFRLTVPNSATTYAYRLPTSEASLITSYTDLQLRFVMQRVVGGGGAARTCRVYWAEIELPLAVATEPDADNTTAPTTAGVATEI